MELRVTLERISFVLLSQSVLLLLMVVLLPASETDEQSGSGRPVWNVEQSDHMEPTWNVDYTVLKVGSNLTVSCFVDAIDFQYEVLRVSLLQGDVVLPLVENGLVHRPFSSITRYAASLKEDPVKGVSMTIIILDIQPEDAGTYICHKHLENDNTAILNVTVLAPVTDLYITTMYLNEEDVRVQSDGEVFLQEHDYYGVGCVAIVKGSFTPPDVRIVIDGQDETDSFQSFHQVDFSVLQSGLILWNSHLRLSFVTEMPNPDFNEKQMKCIAVQHGFPEVETSARLTVQYAPLIQCNPERLEARQGTSVTFNCNIRANPGSRIMWSSARGDFRNYTNVFLDETIISSDQSQLKFSIRDVKSINFQRYTITAANFVGSDQATFELVEDPTILAEQHLELESILPEEDILAELPEGVFAEFVNLTSTERSVSSELKTTVSQAKSSSAEVTISVLNIQTMLPEVSSTLQELRSTVADLRSTLSEQKVMVPESAVTLRHVKKVKHGSTTSHFKETQDHLEAVSSSSKTSPVSPELEQPLVPAGVHYSHSQSSSSSSKKDTSSKIDSGKTSTSTSSTPISTFAIQYLSLLFMVVAWL